MTDKIALVGYSSPLKSRGTERSLCIHCSGFAFKSDGKGNPVCKNQADYGECNPSGKILKEQFNVILPTQIRLPKNQICHHNKKLKNCKHCMKSYNKSAREWAESSIKLDSHG